MSLSWLGITRMFRIPSPLLEIILLSTIPSSCFRITWLSTMPSPLLEVILLSTKHTSLHGITTCLFTFPSPLLEVILLSTKPTCLPGISYLPTMFSSFLEVPSLSSTPTLSLLGMTRLFGMSLLLLALSAPLLKVLLLFTMPLLFGMSSFFLERLYFWASLLAINPSLLLSTFSPLSLFSAMLSLLSLYWDFYLSFFFAFWGVFTFY